MAAPNRSALVTEVLDHVDVDLAVQLTHEFVRIP